MANRSRAVDRPPLLPPYRVSLQRAVNMSITLSAEGEGCNDGFHLIDVPDEFEGWGVNAATNKYVNQVGVRYAGASWGAGAISLNLRVFGDVRKHIRDLNLVLGTGREPLRLVVRSPYGGYRWVTCYRQQLAGPVAYGSPVSGEVADVVLTLTVPVPRWRTFGETYGFKPVYFANLGGNDTFSWWYANVAKLTGTYLFVVPCDSLDPFWPTFLFKNMDTSSSNPVKIWMNPFTNPGEVITVKNIIPELTLYGAMLITKPGYAAYVERPRESRGQVGGSGDVVNNISAGYYNAWSKPQLLQSPCIPMTKAEALQNLAGLVTRRDKLQGWMARQQIRQCEAPYVAVMKMELNYIDRTDRYVTLVDSPEFWPPDDQPTGFFENYMLPIMGFGATSSTPLLRHNTNQYGLVDDGAGSHFFVIKPDVQGDHAW